MIAALGESRAGGTIGLLCLSRSPSHFQDIYAVCE
jgi:hypothetical protein